MRILIFQKVEPIENYSRLSWLGCVGVMIFGKVWLIENYSRLGVLVCKSLGKNAKNKALKSSC